MNHPFQARSGLIVVEAELSGPSGKIGADLALDTGATTTIVDGAPLKIIGYDPDASSDRALTATGSGAINVPRLMVNRLTSLGHHAIGLRVLAHSLPDEADVDGLLGLDFFRGLALTIDFRAGQITLS